ncbi:MULTISPECIES: hypothetical protein [unclassified Bradyrhizobium]|nr:MULTISPECIES: hypothetical protein [unclassified Bradyrhizobium]
MNSFIALVFSTTFCARLYEAMISGRRLSALGGSFYSRQILAPLAEDSPA